MEKILEVIRKTKNMIEAHGRDEDSIHVICPYCGRMVTITKCYDETKQFCGYSVQAGNTAHLTWDWDSAAVYFVSEVTEEIVRHVKKM